MEGIGKESVLGGLALGGTIFSAGFLLAPIRINLLVPRMGRRYAELTEMLPMNLLIYYCGGVFPQIWEVPHGTIDRLIMGHVASGTVLGGELLLSYALEGRTPWEFVKGQDPVAWAAFMLSMAFLAIRPSFSA